MRRLHCVCDEIFFSKKAGDDAMRRKRNRIKLMLSIFLHSEKAKKKDVEDEILYDFCAHTRRGGKGGVKSKIGKIFSSSKWKIGEAE